MSSQEPGPVPWPRQQPTLRIIAWAIGIIAAVAVVSAAKLAGEIIAPTVLAGLIALTLAPVAVGLERLGLPAYLSAGALVLLGVLIAAGGVYLLTPSAEEWRLRAPSVIRSIEWQLRDLEQEIEQTVDTATIGNADQSGDRESTADAVMKSGQKVAADVLLATPRVALTFLYVAFLCFFLLAERAALRSSVLRLCPDWRTRLRLSRAIRDMPISVSHYLLTVTIINAGLGLSAGIAFWLLGLPNPSLWGTMVAILNFMPYVGPLIANIIILAVGLVTFPSFVDALYPVLALVALNMIEGQLVTPMVVGRHLRVGPLSVFMALAFGAWLWGALGAIVATPSLIVAHRFSRHMIVSRVRRRPMLVEPGSPPDQNSPLVHPVGRNSSESR